MDIKKLDTELNEVINELKINIETHEEIIKETKKLGKEYNKYLTKVDAVLDNAEGNAKNIILLKEKAENASNELSLENENVFKKLEESKVIITDVIKESTDILNEVSELNLKIDMEKGKATEKVFFIESKKQDAESALAEVNNILLSIKNNQDNQTKLIEDYEKIKTKLKVKDEEMLEEYNKYLTKIDFVLGNAEENIKNIILLKEKAENTSNELSLENEIVSKKLEESKVIIKGSIKESTNALNKVSELNQKIDIEKDKAVESVSFIEDKKQYVENILAEANDVITSIKNSQDNQTKLIEEYEKMKTKLNVKDEEMLEGYNKYLTRIDFVLGNAEENVKNIMLSREEAENILVEVNNIMLSIKNNQDNQTKLIEEYEEIKAKLNFKGEEMIKVIKTANEKVENMSQNYKDLNKTNFYLKISLMLGTISIICNAILFFRG